MKRKNEGMVLIAIMMIAIGIAFSLSYLGIPGLTVRSLWPIFPLSVGLGLFGMFFIGERRQGVLMPATILTIFSLTFFHSIRVGWSSWAHIWPIAPTSVGLGFYMMYFFGKREKELLAPATILVIVGLIFFLIFYIGGPIKLIWPLILIIVGGFLIFVYFRRR